MKKTRRELYKEAVNKLVHRHDDLLSKYKAYMDFLETQTILKKPEKKRNAGLALFYAELEKRIVAFGELPANQTPPYQKEYLEKGWDILWTLRDEWNYKYKLKPHISEEIGWSYIDTLKKRYATLHPELAEADEILRLLARLWAKGIDSEPMKKRFKELVHDDMSVVWHLPVITDLIEDIAIGKYTVRKGTLSKCLKKK